MLGEFSTAAATADFSPRAFRLGDWCVDPESGRIAKGDTEVVLEPQLMALLMLMTGNPGRVVSRATIEAALWPDVIVGEDTLARTVSRLRRALGDSARSPRYIETLPKRGYRLIAAVEPLIVSRDVESPAAAGDMAMPLADGDPGACGRSPGADVAVAGSPPRGARRMERWIWIGATAGLAVLTSAWIAMRLPSDAPPPADPLVQQVARADDLYMRFTRADNEAAIGLYEQVLAQSPDDAGAQAGLANALVQRVVRWPRDSGATGATTLAEALDRGLTRGPEADAVLARAVAMAERAVRIAPRNPDALKSLAFAYTARGDLERATDLYQEVLSLDGDAWAALINLGEIASMQGEPAVAIGYFEEAWAAMSRAYAYEPQRVGPWQVALGVVIGEGYERLARPADAELWYRRVLAEAPYEPEATARLAQLLARSGDAGEARALCRALTERIGTYPGCALD
jgi:transcriptional activator of cad operon